MQYALLIYRGSYPQAGSEAWNAISEEERKALSAEYVAFNKLPGVDAGMPFGMPEEARTVSVRDGKIQAREGTYFPEAVTSIKMVEADSLEAAIEVAAKIPAARLGGAVEVRPIQRYW
jgi:hypothetical protein